MTGRLLCRVLSSPSLLLPLWRPPSADPSPILPLKLSPDTFASVVLAPPPPLDLATLIPGQGAGELCRDAPAIGPAELHVLSPRPVAVTPATIVVSQLQPNERPSRPAGE